MKSQQTRHRRSTNSAARPSSWTNVCWVKSSVGELLSSKPEDNTSSISQVDTQIDVNGTIILLDMLVKKVTGQNIFLQ